MKKLQSLSVLIVLFFFTACQKPIVFVEGSGPGGGKVTGGPGNTGTNVYMKAKVGGVLVECSTVVGAVMPISGAETVLQISGFKGNESLTLMLNDYKGIGTYDLVDNIGSYIGNILDPNTAYFAETGTVRIIEATDKYAKGVFEFQSINGNGEKKTITEGQFMVKLETTAIPTDPSSSNSKINVKLDGTQTTFDGQIVIIGATNIIGINGTKTFTLGFFDFNGVGTYDVVEAINKGVKISYIPDLNSSYEAISGKIKVTASTSERIVGTFEGVLKLKNSTTTIQVTAGSFDVLY
jgi:hypothetical protein